MLLNNIYICDKNFMEDIMSKNGNKSGYVRVDTILSLSLSLCQRDLEAKST